MTTVAAGSGLRRSTTVAEQEWGIAEIRQASIDKNGGYITQDELPAIIAINRLEQLLIRHSHGRRSQRSLPSRCVLARHLDK